MINLLHGDCLEQMKTLDDNSVDSIVSDPPYGISFMAKKWDYDVPSVEVWKEAMRVLKPGGHALIACGTRTQHRMVVNIEDAGFEIRDVVSWIYGSGFPKSLNIGKAIDKARTEDNEPSARVAAWLNSFMPEGWNMNQWRKHLNRNVVGVEHGGGSAQGWTTETTEGQVKPRVPTVEQWATLKELLALPDDMDAEVWRLNGNKGQPGENFKSREVVGKSENGIAGGSGEFTSGNKNTAGFKGEFNITAPATEAAKQWDGWGTALKPACEFFTLARKPLSEKTVAANVLKWGTGGINIDGCRVGTETITVKGGSKSGKFEFCANYTEVNQTNTGRFPANLIHDGSQEVLELFPETKDGKATAKSGKMGYHGGRAGSTADIGYGGKGSAARFFYCPKASKKDRNEGCEDLEVKPRNTRKDGGSSVLEKSGAESTNNHPTVKPTALMRYLCRLITPTGGTVLDPYMGSGSTGKAAVQEGFSFVGCELDKDYFDIATARVTNEKNR